LWDEILNGMHREPTWPEVRELCEMVGVAAGEAIVSKVADPSVELTLCSRPVAAITSVEHFGDGLLVVAAAIAGGDLLEFQFSPDYSRFAVSAMDADGAPLCRGPDRDNPNEP
jgi:hypothetical protein